MVEVEGRRRVVVEFNKNPAHSVVPFLKPQVS
jgi:hypothetical protein